MLPRKYQKTVRKSIANKISLASAASIMAIISTIISGIEISDLKLSSPQIHFRGYADISATFSGSAIREGFGK
jgi:hypothetical protein